jgi:hypothetical protein
MHALKNPKHERFARLLSQGLTQVDAFRKCYPDQKPESVAANAHKLANQLDVSSRVAEIREMVDSQFAMTLGEKRDILRRMIEGQIPTKVIRKADGKIDAIFDRMAALQMDAKIGGEFAPDQLQIQNQGPTLKLDFQVLGRNTRLSPAMEAEWKEMKAAGPEVRALPEAPAGQQEDFSEYLEAEVRPHKITTLDSIKPIIDITPEEAG